ncbi:hypothetical protein OH76DRAFT_1412042 [Lentinus brumalis]|uniref:Uncharacterized protein n=1 Tax=Lentinus brumalis TaxID=2498619 RepID=A0A371CMJ9_9APHY|nr:hypothetical protein OH76DRAFT_1412042 [Polyporus brumalis]
MDACPPRGTPADTQCVTSVPTLRPASRLTMQSCLACAPLATGLMTLDIEGQTVCGRRHNLVNWSSGSPPFVMPSLRCLGAGRSLCTTSFSASRHLHLLFRSISGE